MKFEDIQGPDDVIAWLIEHTEGQAELVKAAQVYDRLLTVMSDALPNDVDSYTIFSSGTLEDEHNVEHNAYAMCRSLTQQAVVGDCHAITFITDKVHDMIVDIAYHTPSREDIPVAGEYDKMRKAAGEPPFLPGYAAHRH